MFGIYSRHLHQVATNGSPTLANEKEQTGTVSQRLNRLLSQDFTSILIPNPFFIIIKHKPSQDSRLTTLVVLYFWFSLSQTLWCVRSEDFTAIFWKWLELSSYLPCSKNGREDCLMCVQPQAS